MPVRVSLPRGFTPSAHHSNLILRFTPLISFRVSLPRRFTPSTHYNNLIQRARKDQKNHGLAIRTMNCQRVGEQQATQPAKLMVEQLQPDRFDKR